MKRTKIIDVLKSTSYGEKILVKGWVRTHRSSKAVDFIALNDGSTIKNVQIVVDAACPVTGAFGSVSGVDDVTDTTAPSLKDVTTGACIAVSGTLVESPAPGQPH